eukprot:s3287_g13.t1
MDPGAQAAIPALPLEEGSSWALKTGAGARQYRQSDQLQADLAGLLCCRLPHHSLRSGVTFAGYIRLPHAGLQKTCFEDIRHYNAHSHSYSETRDAEMIAELVNEFRAFYDRTSYKPYFFRNDTQVLWESRGPLQADRSEEVRRQVMEVMRIQTAQMEELRRENELLRARQAMEGEQSGEEVRRQVMEVMRIQTAQMEELRRENELLRARQAMEGEQSGPRGDRAMVTQPNVPQGDRALGLQLTVPKGDQTLLEQQGVSQGDRALGVQQSVSQGDRVLSMQPVVPPSDRALGVQLNVPPGDRALGVQQSVPPGDRAYFEQQMRTSNDWPAPFSLREGSSGRSGTVQFEVEQEVESSGLRHADGPTNYPFSGLLQGDVCGVSGDAVPPLVPSPAGRFRGDYGSRPRSRTTSRERSVPPPPPPGIHHGPTPPPPASASATSRQGVGSMGNPLETLVAGMTQIQEVLLKGRSANETAEYDPSKSVVEFPKLKENSAESGAIDFQDWLYLVEQQVGSLASGASSWWSGLLAAAMKAYGVYQASTPIQRLTVRAELPPELDDPKFLKLEKRVAALLVAALPQTMRDEMVSYRVQRVHQQLFRLLVCYQPGGSSDRALVLLQLEPKDGPSDVTEVVTALRKWFRWLQRARDLQLSLPDPSVQIKALSAIVRKVSEKNPDLQFKISLARTELRTESRPTQDTALRFFQHLLAEIEQLGPSKSRNSSRKASAAAASSMTTADDAQAKVRGAQDGKGEGKGSCKWFVSDQGCSRGRACRFLHDWSQVVKAERCLVCGSKQHKVKDCPRKDLEPGNDSLSPKGLNKKELKALATVCSSAAITTAPSPKVPPPLPPPSTAPMTAAAMAAADPPIHPGVSSESLKEVLAETTKVLKALTTTTTTSATSTSNPPASAVQDPLQMLARRLQKFTLNSLGEKMALLDSGASHAYRSAVDSDKHQQAQPVSVKLAEGETTLLQNAAGTLLGDGSSDTLVPLGQLVQILGCSVRWNKNRLIVNHPIHGRLKVQVRDYCPQLAEHEALRLISELEEKRLMEMNNTVKALEMKVAQSGRVMEWFEYIQEYVTTGNRVELLAALTKAPFLKDLSLDTIATAAEGIPVRDVDGWKLLKSMPWSRRKRRTLYQSEDWNVHLFCGPSRSGSKDSTISRLSVTEVSGVNVEVDILDSALMDVTRMDGVFKVLLWGAARGRIRALIGGPPRRSYLVDDEEKRAKEELLIVRMLILAMVAMEGRRQFRSERVGFALEHPDKAVAQGNVWSSSLWTGFCDAYGMELLRPHRRVAHKSAYVLSADVAGPFRVKGVSTETNQHRFMLVCAYQFPKLPGTSETQHEPLDEDTGGGAGIGDLLFEEEGEDHHEIAEKHGENKHEIVENEVADKHEIVEGDGGMKADESGRSNPEEEAAKSFEPLEFSVAYFVRPMRTRKSTEVKTWWPMAAETAATRVRQEKKGHFVLTDDDHLWNTCNVRQFPDVPMEPDPSTMATKRRIVGKRPPVAPIPLKALQASSRSKGVCDNGGDLAVESIPVSEIKSVAKIEYLPKADMMKPLAQISFEKQWYSLEDCFAILEDTTFKKPTKTRDAGAWGDPGPDAYAVFGAYQHGSFVGITKATREYPELVKYLTAFIARHSGVKDKFTSVVVARNLETGLHRDRYNVSGMRNIVISCGAYEQGGLWVEGVHEDAAPQPLSLPNGEQIEGRYVMMGFSFPNVKSLIYVSYDFKEEQLEFDYCETSDEEEHFTQGAVTESELVNLRMLLDEEEKLEYMTPGSQSKEELDAITKVNVKAMRLCEALEAAEANRRAEAGDLDSLRWFQLCRLVESGEQHGVEELLRHLEAPLQVVYTLTLGEVRENVVAWKKAILKEVQALINCGALVRLNADEEDRLQREGKLVILPAKGVFTVKPPDLQAAKNQLESQMVSRPAKSSQMVSSQKTRSWFSKRTESDYVAAYIVVYVDDIMYLGEPSTIADVHAWLGAEQRFLCQLCNRG